MNNPWRFKSSPAHFSRRTAAGAEPAPLTPSGAPRYRDRTHVRERSGMLTPRQRQIWDFLVDYVDRHGYPPTVREIGEAVGLASPSTVHAHLANLERAGLLRRDPTKPRALELIGRERSGASRPTPETHVLPLLGQIAAGGPLLAERVDRGLPRRARAARPRRRRVHPPRQGRLDGQRRHPRRRLRRRAQAAGRAERRRSSWRSPATTRRPTRRP